MARPALCCWIVDDDLSFGRSLQRLLNSRGIPAEFFGSAQSFLDSVPPGQTGFAIVNIGLPGCDGFGLLGRMRELHYGMPVVLASGEENAALRDRAAQAGAAGFLQKPFSWESLLELIRKLELSAP